MSNPNKSNQYSADPRQTKFLSLYTNPESETYSNAYQSALKAGYENEYARNITNLNPTWLSEAMDKLNENELLRKAEKVLNNTLTYEPVDEEGRIDTNLLRTQNNTAQFIAKTVGKAKYSERREITGANGGAIQVQQELREQVDKALEDVI